MKVDSVKAASVKDSVKVASVKVASVGDSVKGGFREGWLS